jgi:large subunit ribosomal protein L18
MPKIKHNLSIKKKRKIRVRANIHGSTQRPRVSIFRSNKHFYLQVIDDDKGVTLAGANDLKDDQKQTKSEKAKKVAEVVAEQLAKKKVKNLVFDRGQYRYHGRVKVAAQTLREAGFKF